MISPEIYRILYPQLNTSEIQEVERGLEEILVKTLIAKENFPAPPEGHRHLMTLFSVALQIKAKTILELGVRYGDWSQPLLMASILNGGKLTSVDKEDTLNPNLDNKWARQHRFVEPTIQILYSKNDNIKKHFEFVLSDSIGFLEKCLKENRRFDMYVIDDWHTYEHVKKEIELIEPLCDYNTIILMHDLMGLGKQPYYHLTSSDKGGWENGGPYKAVKELDPDKWEWSTIPVNSGLTILKKRSPVFED